MYERLKKNMECRWAMVSQMVNCVHAKKAQPQYCSNVCMKFNAKLGGTTCKVVEKPGTKPFFTKKTMVIGKSFPPQRSNGINLTPRFKVPMFLIPALVLQWLLWPL